MGVDFEGKVLKAITVPRSICRVLLGKLKSTGVSVLAVMLNNAFANIGDVEKTVEKVRGPVEVGSTRGDSVTVHAHALERTAEFVG